jgi:hypothetical protein
MPVSALSANFPLSEFLKRRAGLFLFTENEQSPDFLAHPEINESSISRWRSEKSSCNLIQSIAGGMS